MPIGIVSDTDFEKEIGNYKPEVVIESIPRKGRSEGDVNVPDSLRKIIGETAVTNGRDSAVALAREFGISPSSVSAYAVGATSTTTYHEPKKDIISHINSARKRVSEKAEKKLELALDGLTPDKLQHVKARDIASIAKDMSVVIKNMEPPVEQTDSSSSPQFVIFAPQFRKEETFQTIILDE